jgi:hypothetical protein
MTLETILIFLGDLFQVGAIFGLGMVAGLMLADKIVFPTNVEKKNTPCTHGHEDWDDCPVCGH